MTPSELTDASVGVYQVMGWLILRLTAGPAVLCVAALVFITTFVIPNLFTTSHPGSMSYQVIEAISALVIGLLVGGPLLGIGVGYSGIIITGLASDYMEGEVANPEKHLRNARRLIWKVVGLCLNLVLISLGAVLICGVILILSSLFGNNPDDTGAELVVGLAYVGLVVGGILSFYILARNILALPVLVLEGLSVRQSLRRGRQLMNAKLNQPSGGSASGNALGAVLFLILFIFGGVWLGFNTLGIPTIVSGWMAGSPFHDLVLYTVESLPSFLAFWTVVPVWCVSATVLYYERRTRLEGYDIEVLARDLTKHGKQNRFDV